MPTATIGLDCRLSGLQHGGIGRYQNEVFSRILSSRDYDYVVYVAAESQKKTLSLSVKDESHIQWRIVPIRHYSVEEQVRWPRILQKDSLDLLHVPHFNAPVRYDKQIIVTIHDLLWHEQRGASVTTLPAWVYWPKYVAYRYVAQKAIEHATRVLVPSEVIRETVSTVVPGTDDKIDVTYEGVDPSFKPKKLAREKNSLLYVGSLYPHKNVSLLLQSVDKLRDWKLKIISSRSVFATDVEKLTQDLGIENRVEFVFSVSEHELVRAYQTCTALVQPSLSEGFGLTGVEALACHTPVLASNIPIFNEIYGDFATFFNPRSVESLSDAILHPNQIKFAGLDAFLQRYNWDETAAKTIESYKKALT